MAAIKDLFGRVVDSLKIWDRQTDDDTAGVGTLHKEFSSHPSSGLTPARLASLMRDAEMGNLRAQCELAEDIEEKDAHIFSELQKRRRVLTSMDFQVQAPKDATDQEKEDAARIEEWLESFTWLDGMRFDLTDAILKSFSCCELKWQREGKLWLPSGYVHQPATWFQVDPDDRNELRLRDNSHNGAELQPFGWVKHITKAKSGYLVNSALVRVLAWPYLFKNYSVRDLAEFLEIYGLPLRLGKYPSGASKEEKRTLLRAVMSIGHNAGGIVPRGMDIEFQEAAKGSSDPYKSMMDWAEKSQSKAILGGTLTSQADGKSSTNALGTVHNDVREELRDADLKALAATLTRDLVYPLYVMNCKSYRDPKRHPRITFDTTEPEDLTQYAESLPKLVELGLKIPAKWAHEKLHIPEAEGGEDILVMAAKPSNDPAALRVLTAPVHDQGQTGFAALKKQVLPVDEQAMETLLAGIDTGQINEQMDGMLKPIFEALKSDPESAINSMAELFPKMDDGQLQEKLARIMFVGEIWGRLNSDD